MPNVNAILVLESQSRGNADSNPIRPTSGSRCFNCGASGHFARQCPDRGKMRPSETLGRSQGGLCPTVAKIASNQKGHSKDSPEQRPDRVEELHCQLQEAELKEALTQVATTMHGIQSTGASENAQLGPTLTADVKKERSMTKALLGTGSPVSIVSLQ